MQNGKYCNRISSVLRYSALALGTLVIGTVAGTLTGHADTVQANVGALNTYQSIPVQNNALSVSHVYHVAVQSGQSMQSIAETYSSTVPLIERANHLNNDLVYAGEHLEVPSLQSGNGGSSENGIMPSGKPDVVRSSGETSHGITAAQQGQDNQSNVQSCPGITGTEQRDVPQKSNQSNGQSASRAFLNKDEPSQAYSLHSEGIVPSVHSPSMLSNAKTVNDAASRTGMTPQQAENWIVQRESGGNYHATNGNCYGKYQLDRRYLKGDYTPTHQDEVANRYVNQRYGGWVPAQRFWSTHHWY